MSEPSESVLLRKPIDVLAEGLGHPEGPDVFPDGRVVCANSFFNEVSVIEGGFSRYAFTGGCPNACKIGSDGAVYVTQCPGVGPWIAPHPQPPSIQRIDVNGAVGIVVTEADGVPLIAPNDLAFGNDGSLYFTDSGEYDPVRKPDPGRICAIRPDGRCEIVEEPGNVYPNGIVVEANGSIIWVESYTRAVRRRRPDGSIELLTVLAEQHVPDGLKLDHEGNLWICSCESGGLDIVSPEGQLIGFLETGGVPLNCTFDGSSLIVCDLGSADAVADTPMVGRVLRAHVGVAGMPIIRGQLPVPVA